MVEEMKTFNVWQEILMEEDILKYINIGADDRISPTLWLKDQEKLCELNSSVEEI
jgi:hypothetical protein